MNGSGFMWIYMNEMVFLKIFNRSLTSCSLILAVILFRFLLKKAPAYFRIVLWIIVGIRLMMPFDIRTDFSLIPNPEPLSAYTVQNEIRPTIDTGLTPIDDMINPVFSETFEADPDVAISPLNYWTLISSWIWVIGIAAILIHSSVSYYRLKRLLADSVPENGTVWISDRIDTPFVLGIIKPKIYLPSSLNDKDREHVLSHEIMHIRKKDHILKLAAYCISAIHWFNPLVWVAYILFSRDLELACDESVIKDLETPLKKEYADALLNCSSYKKKTIVYPLAFSETGTKERIKRILDHKKPAFWLTALAVMICIVTATCFLSNPKSKTETIGSFSFNSPKKLKLAEKNGDSDLISLDWAYDVRYLADEEKAVYVLLAKTKWDKPVKEVVSDNKAMLIKGSSVIQDVVNEEGMQIFREEKQMGNPDRNPLHYFGYYSKDGKDYWAEVQFWSDLPEDCRKELLSLLKSLKCDPDASYLIENFDRKNTDKITINYDFDYSEYESTDRFYSKEVILADLDPKDQKRIMKQIESILTDEEFEEVPSEEIRGGSQYRLLILDAKQVNITVYQKEGYIATKDPESDTGMPLVYKVNNDKLDKLCDLVDEATAEIEPS